MSGRLAVLIMSASIVGGGHAYAQESGPAPGKLEITYIPGGAAFFTSKNDSPSFGNYGLGTAAAYNINRLIGIEGEVFGVIGVSSDLQLDSAPSNIKAPNGVSYTGNLVVSPFNYRSLIPYGTAGLGMIRAGTNLEDRSQNNFAGNVGGGVMYSLNTRVALRGDARYFRALVNEDEPRCRVQRLRLLACVIRRHIQIPTLNVSRCCTSVK